MRVTAPASSANLGPGFDVLALALDLAFVLSDEPDDDLLAAEVTHPAAVAFRAAGGSGALWWRSPIPPGRGLGFSGAARVAGALLGTAVAGGVDRDRALEIASGLEGHPENAAASMLGGAVAASGGVAVRFPVGLDVKVVVWTPPSETSTDKARSRLPDSVRFEDATFNVGRAALLVAALAAGDRRALRVAAQDRLHQTARLERAANSRAAFDAAWSAEPLAAWLSGSGPTIAALVAPDDVDRLAMALPDDGRVRVLDIDTTGAQIA